MTGGNVQQGQARELFASLVEATRLINNSARERKLDELDRAIAAREEIMLAATPVSGSLDMTERIGYLSAVQEMDHETHILIEQYKQEIIRSLKELNRNRKVLTYSRKG